MLRVFCIIPLALAAVSAVSGHVIRRHQKPPGWETEILQNYDVYHERYLKWNCQKQHNSTYFDKCCHPLLKGEPMSVLENLGCDPGDECDDGDSSVLPSSTPSTQPAHANAYSPAPPSSSSKPAGAALAKGNDSPSPSPQPTTTTPTSTPIKSSTSPPPAQTSASGGGGGDVHNGGVATFFFQNGVAGACGAVHQDTDLICAMDSILYEQQDLCGKKVLITNTQNGKSVTVTVRDECPTCNNANSIDLSHGAFGMIATYDQGQVPIKWEFV